MAVQRTTRGSKIWLICLQRASVQTSRGDGQGRSLESIRLDCHSEAGPPPAIGQEHRRERREESHFHLTGNERGPCVWRPAQLLSFSFSLGRLSNHAVTFHFKVTACYIWYLFFFFQLLFLQTELYRNLKVFNFLHPKYQLKKQTKNLFSGKWNFLLMLFFALNCFEILLEALRITHNMIPQPVEVWCHYCTETWLSATQEMHHIFKI